jgi:hypothetical protein
MTAGRIYETGETRETGESVVVVVFEQSEFLTGLTGLTGLSPFPLSRQMWGFVARPHMSNAIQG